jgi:hypothetical protein
MISTRPPLRHFRSERGEDQWLVNTARGGGSSNDDHSPSPLLGRVLRPRIMLTGDLGLCDLLCRRHGPGPHGSTAQAAEGAWVGPRGRGVVSGWAVVPIDRPARGVWRGHALDADTDPASGPGPKPGRGRCESCTGEAKLEVPTCMIDGECRADEETMLLVSRKKLQPLLRG